MAAQHFDVIIVGSGFGGSVTAYRMAEGGRSVCVLERGKAYPPHSFPRSPLGVSQNLWDPSAGLHGMFDLWSFQGLEALVSSGLGGGSLIYANVILRKDEKWFVKEDPASGGLEHWPVTRADLDPHYDRVERMLGVQRYPLDQPPFDKTSKTLAFRGAADELDLDWFLPPLAVTFANEGEPARVGAPIAERRENLHRRPRTTCQLVGECDIGCNYGAKNSLDYNYLTEAWHAGADIRTRCEVKAFEPRDGGYSVHYVEHSEDAEGHETDTGALPRTTLTCDRLVLSAGTLGTPYLLMRNRGAFPGISRLLGTRFSGNGDLLTFAMRCSQDGEDGKRIPRVIDPAHGPVITSAIRVPDALDGGDGRGFYLEDAGYPEFVSWMLQATDLPGALLRAAPIVKDVILHRLGRQADTNLSAELQSMLGDCGVSAGVLPLLGMGRDVPDGNMTIDSSGRLEVDWRKRGRSADYFDRVREVARQVSEKLGGTFLDNPIWHLNHVITVHPLGGCPMGESPERGVVDPVSGQVWGYEGLHVADGSVMPGPVGANPSATIAALADRFADAVLEGRGPAQPRAAAAAVRNGGGGTAPPAAPPRAGAVSLEFTEEMKGFLTFGEDDYDVAYRDGKRHKRRLMFRLTIRAEDVERFIDDPRHLATAEGYVKSDSLGGERPVERGVFNLFVDQAGHRDRKRMYYRLHFSDAEGHPLTLIGHKVVEDDPGFDVWSDTSTLFTTILAGHVDEGGDDQAQSLARGILHILPLDFAKQLTTFRTEPAHRLDAIARFGALFAGDLWEVYGRRAQGEQVRG